MNNKKRKVQIDERIHFLISLYFGLQFLAIILAAAGYVIYRCVILLSPIWISTDIIIKLIVILLVIMLVCVLILNHIYRKKIKKLRHSAKMLKTELSKFKNDI